MRKQLFALTATLTLLLAACLRPTDGGTKRLYMVTHTPTPRAAYSTSISKRDYMVTHTPVASKKDYMVTHTPTPTE